MAPPGCLAGLSAMLCCGSSSASSQAPAAPAAPTADDLRSIIAEAIKVEVRQATVDIEAGVGEEMQSILSRLKKGGHLKGDINFGSSVASIGRRYTEPVRDRNSKRRNSMPCAWDGNIAPIRSAPEVTVAAISRSSTDSVIDHVPQILVDQEMSRCESESDAHAYLSEATTPHTHHETDTDGETDGTVELQEALEDSPECKVGTIHEIPARHRRRSSSWRRQAMDLGEKKAISGKQEGGASVIGIVQSERERWMHEKEELEMRLSALKARQETEAKPRLDKEKEELKKQLSELRKAVAERSRFGAWVCERHLHESDDEDDNNGKANEKEKLRLQLEGLEAKLRAARVKLGTVNAIPRRSWRRPSACEDVEVVMPFKAGTPSPTDDG